MRMQHMPAPAPHPPAAAAPAPAPARTPSPPPPPHRDTVVRAAMGVDARERAEVDKRAREVDEQVDPAEDATATEERRKFRAV